MYTLDMYKSFTIKIWDSKVQWIVSDSSNVIVHLCYVNKTVNVVFIRYNTVKKRVFISQEKKRKRYKSIIF